MRQLPSLKQWHHTTSSMGEDYTIVLSPNGKRVPHRTVPKARDVIYAVICDGRRKNRWYVEYATASGTVNIDEDGNTFDGIAVGSDRVFTTALKARAAANRHWQKAHS